MINETVQYYKNSDIKLLWGRGLFFIGLNKIIGARCAEWRGKRPFYLKSRYSISVCPLANRTKEFL